MEFSPALLLVPYLVAIVVVLLISVFALYRLIHFGGLTAGAWLMITIFTAGMLATFFGTAAALASFDWSSAAGEPVPMITIPSL